MLSKFLSRKFLAGLAGAAVSYTMAQAGFGADVIAWTVASIAAFILGEAAVDTARALTPLKPIGK